MRVLLNARRFSTLMQYRRENIGSFSTSFTRWRRYRCVGITDGRGLHGEVIERTKECRVKKYVNI